MAILLQTPSAHGKIVEFEMRADGLYTRDMSKLMTGLLGLLSLDDRDEMRISFVDLGNGIKAMTKIFTGLYSGYYHNNPFQVYNTTKKDYLCHFDFTWEEIRTRKKEFKCIIECNLSLFSICYVLCCLDNRTGAGRYYYFNSEDELLTWGKALRVKEIEYSDENGDILKKVSIN